MNWLKWYLSQPLKALAWAVFWIARVRAGVRERLGRFDWRRAVQTVTVGTAVLWLVVWAAADDVDRARLSDTVKQWLSGAAQ